MPQTNEYRVTAKQVRVGDEVMFPGKGYAELVDDIDPKVKYTTISTDYGRTRIELTTEVTVWREEPTEEERVEQNQRRNEEYCYGTYGALLTRLEEKKAELAENLHIKDPTWHGRIWEDVAQTQYEIELWESVMTVAENREINVVEALRLVRDQVREDFPRRYNFLPNSTSAISNYCNQLKNAVTAQWLRELEYRLY